MKNILQPNLQFTAVYEVEIHYIRPVFSTLSQITRPEDAVKLIHIFTKNTTLDVKEYFWVVLLNTANRLLGIAEVAKGNEKCVIVPNREIFQLALKTNACAIILCHNHPSGSLKPSEGDINITKKIIKAGKLLDIQILDHLIITSETFLSMSNEGYF